MNIKCRYIYFKSVERTKAPFIKMFWTTPVSSNTSSAAENTIKLREHLSIQNAIYAN